MIAKNAPVVATVIVAGLVFALLFTSVEAREFTSSTGQEIQAEIVAVDGNLIQLKRASGRNVTAPISRFSEPDRKFIADWKAKKQNRRACSLEGQAATHGVSR